MALLPRNVCLLGVALSGARAASPASAEDVEPGPEIGVALVSDPRRAARAEAGRATSLRAMRQGPRLTLATNGKVEGATARPPRPGRALWWAKNVA